RVVNGRIEAGEALEKKYKEVFALEAKGRQADADALFNNLYDGSGLTRADVARVVALSPETAGAPRGETARLPAGDPENRALWQAFMPHCLKALQAIYDRLGIHFDVQLGESFYDPMLADVVADLQAKGLAVESEGATVVFVEGSKVPFIVRKSDGAF